MKICDFCNKKAFRLNLRTDYYYVCENHKHLKLLDPRISHGKQLDSELLKYNRKR